MGILDSKTRILDTILTPEGRSQLSKGQLRTVFYSFTDSGAVYKEDTLISASITGSAAAGSEAPKVLDATFRFNLEATGLPQDQIAFEADDSGRLVGFPVSGSEKLVVLAGQVFSGSKVGSRVQITGSQFNSIAGTLLSSSIDAFKNQMILRSPDPLDDKERKFLVGPKSHEFSITKNKPFNINEDASVEINVDHAESFFQDKKLNHIENFKYLPPVNRARAGETTRTQIANYVDINQPAIDRFETLEQELKGLDSVTVNFTETSKENNLLCQFFETSNGIMRKLDIIDFGSFVAQGENSPKHVFFAGKIFTDDNDSPTFVNMFTLIFEN